MKVEMRREWYELPGTPDAGLYWWAVEHQGHPAFYLRSLIPGDFAPGRGPLARHVLHLDGVHAADDHAVHCGTCGLVPDPKALEPVERVTGARGALDAFRRYGRPWPPATNPRTCWSCGTTPRESRLIVETPGGPARVCARCSPYFEGEGR